MKYLFLICLFFFVFKSASQTINYKETFGKDYEAALQLIKKNDSLFIKYATDYSIDEKVLKAIIFPELIRYNRVYDAIEITSLKFLYVKKGSYYNDFSVGYFQMKPSFAEQIEIDANTVLEKSLLKKTGFDSYNKKIQSEYEREQRLTRITNFEGQLKYLVVFYKICEKKFKNRKFKNDREKLEFYATAYNLGYFKSENTLNNCLQAKLFHIGKLNTSDTHNYASISTYYYEN